MPESCKRKIKLLYIYVHNEHVRTKYWIVEVEESLRLSFFPYEVHAGTVVSYQNIKTFHQNESCLSCPHPPSSYEGRREQGRLLSF